MRIVDSQVHIWGPDTPERPWPKGRTPPKRSEPLGADEVLREMKAAGVDRVVLVPPAWEGDRNDLVLAATKAHPDRFAAMGRIDPQSPATRGTLATWRQQPGMLGLRFSFHTPLLSPLLTEGHMDWVWDDAQKYGIPIYVLVSHGTVHLIDAAAQRYPGLKFVLDHMALGGPKRDAEAFQDFGNVLAVAKRPNIAAKLSALPSYMTADTYPYRSLHPYIRQAYDAFGPKRLFWGSEFSLSPISYRQNITLYTEELPWLTDEDREWIMGRGVCEWLGWKI